MFLVPTPITSLAAPAASGDYFVRVRGLNAAVEGPASNEVRLQVGTPSVCATPEAPVLLPATIVDGRITVTWRGSRNAAVRRYVVLVGSQPGAGNLAAFDAGPVTVFAAAAPPGTYYVSIVASSDCGSSPASNTIRVDVGTGPPAPGNLRASVDGASVTLAWDAAPVWTAT